MPSMNDQDNLLARYDPNGPGIPGNLFGLPYTPESASIVIIPVPWEVTISYGSGTSAAPEMIRHASMQVDIATHNSPDNWKLGISMLPESNNIVRENAELRMLAKEQILKAEQQLLKAEQQRIDPVDLSLKKINEGCEKLNQFVAAQARQWMDQKKLLGLVGGDHSSSIGLIRALSEKNDRFGILQIDAHCDLRKAYEGFTYSHASAMFNALKLPAVSKLVQVGIRDYCAEELVMIDRGMGRIKSFFDRDLKEQLFTGKTWDDIASAIVKELPSLVYISFDIDGLDPKLCPLTGTPVPGGLEFEQAAYLLKKIVQSGRRIIGFDLCEVGNDEWDANVGARILYQLCYRMAVSNKLKAEG